MGSGGGRVHPVPEDRWATLHSREDGSHGASDPERFQERSEVVNSERGRALLCPCVPMGMGEWEGRGALVRDHHSLCVSSVM